MRRPAQHRYGPTANSWAHPYTGVAGLAVFYNDGGNPPAPAPAAGEPKPAEPPKPGPPPVVKEFTQEDLERVAAREKAQGKRSALKEFAEEHGFTSPEDAATFIAAARQAQDAALSEQEKRERELAEREAKAEAREKAAIERERVANRRAVLVGLGATGADLEDAVALLRVADDADDTAVQEAADALKARRPELFGTKLATEPVPPALPPAPGGAPAGGPGPKQPASKDDIKARALERAQKMGYAPKPAA